MPEEIEEVKPVGAEQAVTGFPVRLTRQRSGQAKTGPAPKRAASGGDVGLVFEVGRGGEELVIKIVERESRRVIREIPPEEVRQLRATMRALLGINLDRQG